MAERSAEDVKLRPIPGDVLRRDMADRSQETRQVTRVTNAELVDFHRRNAYARKATTVCDVWCHMGHWKRWARTAEVIHIAQPAGTAGEEA